MPRHTRFVALLVALALSGLPAPGHAAFHLMNIRELFPGTSGSPGAQYVMLQMYASGQNFVGGHAVTFFNASGTIVNSYSFPSMVPSGNNQDTILIATAAASTLFGVSADLTMTAGDIQLAGGKICFDTVDCVTWGSYAGSGPVGTPYRSGTGLTLGQAVRRDISGGSNPTMLDAADDTNDSAADFDCSDAAPRNNAGVSGFLVASPACPFCGNNLTEPEIGEVCDGTDDTACPGQCLGTCFCGGDGDGDSLPDTSDPCTTLDYNVPPSDPPDQNPLRAKILLKGLDVSGAHGLIAKGFFNPVMPGTADPATNGVHVHLEDSAGVLYDLHVPGGAIGTPSHCGPDDGWKTTTTASGVVTYLYFNKSGALGAPGCTAGSAEGLFSIQIKNLLAVGKPWKYMVKTKEDTLPHTPAFPVTLMLLDVGLADQPSDGQAAAGNCAENRYSGSPVSQSLPKPFCKRAPATGALKKVLCLGP